MFDLFLFDEQILMPGIISKFLIHLEIRIKLITDREMLLFLFSPFLRSKLQVTVQKTQYIQCISQFDCLKPFVLYSWLANYFQFEKIKGNSFTFHRTWEHVSILTLGNFFLILRIPQLWWALFISTVILKSTYELWILFDIKQYVTACINFTWQCARISIWLVMIDTCIFKELVILGNAW